MKRLLLPHASVSILVCLLLVLGAGRAGAQPQAGRRAAEQAAGPLAPDEIQRLFDAYESMQAREALALSDAQLPSFLAQLTLLQDTRRRNQQERHRIVQKLSRLSGQRGELDEAAVRSTLKELDVADERSFAEARKAYEGLLQTLDLRQQARFRVFEAQMERRKLDLLMRARRRAERGAEPIK